jgi:thioester reductase-like protein
MQIPEIDWERITIVLGDLALQNFGLSEDAFGRLSESVDTILHCGAVVNHILPYSFHKAANVDGTKQVCLHVFCFLFLHC